MIESRYISRSMHRYSANETPRFHLSSLSSLLFRAGLLIAVSLSVQASLAEETSPPLRTLAQQRGAFIGAAVAVAPLRNDSQYAEVLARECNILTPENAMKWDHIEPARNAWSWKDADEIVRFAEQHGMKVRGHTLVWHQQLPQWVKNGTFSREELIEVMRQHIREVAGHYRGKVVAWDVVNEAVADKGGKLRDSVFLRVIGPAYVGMAFRFAREADPEAKLFYNDYGAEGLNEKSDAVYELVKKLKEQGVPIDGVGLQMHLNEAGINKDKLKQNIRRLQALGLEVSITELDVRLQPPITEDKLQKQAHTYREVCDALLQVQREPVIVTWGITDRYSWIPGFVNGFGFALPYDEKLTAKPAYFAIKEALQSNLPSGKPR